MLIFCTGYVIISVGATISYALIASPLRQLDVELQQYFECERVPHSGGNSSTFGQCDRSGFERLTFPAGNIIGWGLVSLYPVATLIYLYKRKSPDSNEAVITVRNSSLSVALTNSSKV